MAMVNNTTFEILDKYDEAEERKRLAVLAEKELNDLGKAYDAQKELLAMVELRCQIRAHRLHTMGQDVKDIASWFGVEPRVVRKWLKGFTSSVVI